MRSCRPQPGRAICCQSKGQRNWRNLVFWISGITEHLIRALSLCVCIQRGPSEAMKFAIVAQCGCFQTLWHDVWVSVLCVAAQCAHCLSHNAPFSCGPPSLHPLTLSAWAVTHSVPLANHHHHHQNPNSWLWNNIAMMSSLCCLFNQLFLPLLFCSLFSQPFCVSKLPNTKDREAATGPQCKLVAKETRRQCWVFKVPQRGVWSSGELALFTWEEDKAEKEGFEIQLLGRFLAAYRTPLLLGPSNTRTSGAAPYVEDALHAWRCKSTCLLSYDTQSELLEPRAPTIGNSESWQQNTLPAVFRKLHCIKKVAQLKGGNRKSIDKSTHPSSAPTHFHLHMLSFIPPLPLRVSVTASSCTADCQQWSHYVPSLSVVTEQAQLQAWSSVSDPPLP